MKHLTCQCSRHCRDSAESTATFRNSIQICRPLRTRDVFTRHAVRSVRCAQRVWSALWARPEMMRARWLDLTWVMHFLMMFIAQMHSLARHSFLIFVVFHHSLQQLLVCLVFLASCPLRSSLFPCLVEARGASSVVLTIAWISLAGQKEYHLAVSVCWNQSSTKNRANGT